MGAVAAVVAFVTGRSLTRFAVAEESMAPSLLPGDYLLARRRKDRPPRRGDVVIFEHPGRDGFFLIKRIVGLPTEVVSIDDGRVLVDGRPIAEPWAGSRTTGDGRWSIGADEVFVLGDSRAASADDSRRLGPVALERIEWRAIARYWPPTRAGRPAAL
jgi:signal peptidase I